MNNHMTLDYIELLKALDERASVARSEGTGTALGDALHFEQAATAIRALVAENERFREALRALLKYAEFNICQHENTHRGGAIWEICSDCGAKWADDEGGKPIFVEPEEITKARAALGETERVVANFATTDPTCKADLQVGNRQGILDSSPYEIRLKALREAQACISFRHMPVEYMRIQRLIDEEPK
jgi:hypothetical protein